MPFLYNIIAERVVKRIYKIIYILTIHTTRYALMPEVARTQREFRRSMSDLKPGETNLRLNCGGWLANIRMLCAGTMPE